MPVTRREAKEWKDRRENENEHRQRNGWSGRAKTKLRDARRGRQIVIQKGIKRRKCREREKKRKTQLLGERMSLWCLRAAEAGNTREGH